MDSLEVESKVSGAEGQERCAGDRVGSEATVPSADVNEGGEVT